MRFPLKRLGHTLALAALGATFAAAQTEPGVDLQFKLRTGYELGNNQDGLKARTLGFGLDLGYETSFGRFGAEIGFQYKPGDQYKSDVNTFPVVAGAPRPDPASSGDIRRNSVEGLALRLSFEKAIPTTSWSWLAGLQIGGAKFRHEYLGDIADAGFATYEDTYNGATTKSVPAISPFVGTAYRFNDTSAVQINLVGVSYTAINYVHVAGQGVDASGHSVITKDYVTEQKRMRPHLEIGYSFRF